MRLRALLVALGIVPLAVLTGCSSAPRAARKPAVAVVISSAAGTQPSPAEIAEIHRLIEPEMARRGYVMAKSSGAADYFVYLRHPVDPLLLGRITLEKAEPRVPFVREQETEQERIQRRNKSAIAEMVREPR